MLPRFREPEIVCVPTHYFQASRREKTTIGFRARRRVHSRVMNRRNLWLLLLVIALASMTACRPAQAPQHTDDVDAAASIEHRRYGEVMTEIGRRFERGGRAVAAGRWELAEYDIGEIGEIFEGDLPNAHPPGEGHADMHALARAFAATLPEDLRRAVATHDRAVFDAAFARAAASCNGCHQAAEKAFIEIPSVVGTPVPQTTPRVAPSSGSVDAGPG